MNNIQVHTALLCQIENCKLLCCKMLNKNNNKKASGHYMCRQWSLYVPPVVTICAASGHYMCRQWSLYVQSSATFKNSTFCPHSCIYVFCVDLRTNSDYFPIQHWLAGFWRVRKIVKSDF